jgi:hypothetical protein
VRGSSRVRGGLIHGIRECTTHPPCTATQSCTPRSRPSQASTLRHLSLPSPESLVVPKEALACPHTPCDRDRRNADSSPSSP